MEYRHLIAMELSQAEKLLVDIPHKIIEHNSTKLKEFDKKIIINVKNTDILTLYVGNFLYSVKE